MTAPFCFAGAVALQVLQRKGISVGAHIASVGSVDDAPFDPVAVNEETLNMLQSRVFPVLDETKGEAMKAEILAAKEALDSVGGIVEACILGLPCGIDGPLFGGLEGKFALALFGIPAVKGVEFGAGFRLADLPGSEAHDPFLPNFERPSNRAGGIEGGMSNGQPLIVRLAMKPIPTMTKPLPSIDLSGELSVAHVERSDVCAVPACGVVAEALVAWELAVALQEKWGGDSLKEMQR
jgi:chorismate synthase